jgi:hypothetical protein
LVEHLVRIRNVCAHKLEAMKNDQLQCICESLCYLNNAKVIPMGLEKPTVHTQLNETLYDIRVLNAHVMTDFIGRNSAKLPEGKRVKWLRDVYPEVKLKNLSYSECMERIVQQSSLNTGAIANVTFTTEDTADTIKLFAEFSLLN